MTAPPADQLSLLPGNPMLKGLMCPVVTAGSSGTCSLNSSRRLLRCFCHAVVHPFTVLANSHRGGHLQGVDRPQPEGLFTPELLPG